MGKLTNWLIAIHIVKGLCGRGPTAFGLFAAVSLPMAVLLVLIAELYPGGLGSFAQKASRTIIGGLH